MKKILLIVFLGVSAASAGPKKTTKRGVFYGTGEGSLDLPSAHHGETHGSILPLEGEQHGPLQQYGPPGHHNHPQFSNIHGAPFGPVLIERSVRHHVQLINKVGIPYPQPVPVQIERQIPIKVPQEVTVPVYRPYPVPVHVKVPVPVYKDVPVPVERKVPVHVKVVHRKEIEVPYKVYHPKPVPVPIWKKVPVPVPKPVIVKRPVPVAIHSRIVPLNVRVEYETLHKDHHHHDHYDNHGHHDHNDDFNQHHHDHNHHHHY